MDKEVKPVYWMGDVADKDDFGVKIRGVFYDGKTREGPWAIMAPTSFAVHGVGVGTGKGQKYEKVGDKWLKVGG